MSDKKFSEDTCNGYTVKELLSGSKLLDESSAAFCLAISVKTLQRDRHINGTNPDVPYIKRGRSVRYEPDTLKKVIEQCRIGQIKTA